MFIIISLSKPAVIHYKQLDSCLLASFCKSKKFSFINIKIGCLPAVQKHRTCFLLPGSAHNMLSYKPMHALAHPIISKRRIYHDCLRCFKSRSRFQLPRKRLGIDSCHKSRFPVTAYFHRFVMVAAVYKVDTITCAAVLICTGFRKHHKRIGAAG